MRDTDSLSADGAVNYGIILTTIIFVFIHTLLLSCLTLKVTNGLIYQE